MENGIRWRQRFENFESAQKQLETACTKDEFTDLEFAGLIKSFEIAFEMARKTLKDLLAYEGYDVKSPRAAIRQAYETGYISKIETWVEALDSRNVLSHNYDKSTAAEAERLIKGSYLPMLTDAAEHLREVRQRS